MSEHIIPHPTIYREIAYIGDDLYSEYGNIQADEMDIAGRRRKLAQPIIDLAVAFNGSDHTGLNHDCTVFGLAHLTNDAQVGRYFYESGVIMPFYGIQIDGFKIQPQPLDSFDLSKTEPGDVLMTSQSSPEEMADGFVYGHHTMIHASEDRLSPPIYVSRFGIDGPVVAHTLGASLHNRPGRTVGVVASFNRVQFG